MWRADERSVAPRNSPVHRKLPIQFCRLGLTTAADEGDLYACVTRGTYVKGVCGRRPCMTSKLHQQISATYRAFRTPVIVSYTSTYQKSRHYQLQLHINLPETKTLRIHMQMPLNQTSSAIYQAVRKSFIMIYIPKCHKIRHHELYRQKRRY